MTEQAAIIKARLIGTAAPAAVLLALALVACAGQAPGSANAQQNIVYSHRVHRMPLRYSAPSPGPAGAHLTYYGGPVISNVNVVQVLYGTGSYAPEISGSQLGNFWTQVTVSPYIDTMSEYSTAGVTPSGGGAGSNQTIGRGTFGGQIQISPSAANTGATITDAQIQAELGAQINAGTLPAPDANTLYMINFPHGVAISQGTSSSCQAGGFCAYHGTFTRGGNDVFYGVLPDMSAGSGCDTGCGSNPTPFNNQTSVASHEFAEAITDAAVGLATSNAPPLAWYDQTNGENGDICNAKQGSFVGSDGVTYTVQQIWSNAANACVDSGASTPPPPPPPSGCTTNADCSNGQVCVSGVCQNPAPPPPPPSGSVITNGDFETGDFTGWNVSGTTSISTNAHGGSSAAQLGSPTPGGDSTASQTIALPAGSPQLSFWYQMSCTDTVAYDWASATLQDAGGNVLATLLAPVCDTSGQWVQVTADLTSFAGQSVVLVLANHDDGNPGDASYSLYDDVTIQ